MVTTTSSPSGSKARIGSVNRCPTSARPIAATRISGARFGTSVVVVVVLLDAGSSTASGEFASLLASESLVHAARNSSDINKAPTITRNLRAGRRELRADARTSNMG